MIGAWTDLGVITAFTQTNPGQPNVLYGETGIVLAGTVFAMWYGTTGGVYYAESANGTSGWNNWYPNSTTPVLSLTTMGLTGRCYPRLFKNSGTYYLYVNDGASAIQCWTSTDRKVWTRQNATAIGYHTQAWESGWQGQLSVAGQDSSGTWHGYYTAKRSGTLGYAIGHATSTDLINWTKDAANPVITTLQPSNFEFHKIGNRWYGWTQILLPALPAGTAGNSIPSDITRFTANSPAGPWTPLIAPGSSSNYVSTFFRTQSTEGVGSGQGQVGDPSIVCNGTQCYFYFSVDTNGTGTAYSISRATAPYSSLSALLATYEGIVDIPTPTSTILALQLPSSGSDSFQRADANPVGGNWTQISSLGGFTSNQIVSHLLEPSAANTVRGGSYWNAVTWPDDQWASVTFAGGLTTTNDSIGVILRGSTTGASNCYVVNINKTSTGFGARIDKVASNTYSNIVNAVYPYTLTVGDVITGVVIGTQISLYVTGNLILTVSDSTYSSGAAGICLYGASAVTGSQASAWSGGSIAAIPGNPNPSNNEIQQPMIVGRPFGPYVFSSGSIMDTNRRTHI